MGRIPSSVLGCFSCLKQRVPPSFPPAEISKPQDSLVLLDGSPDELADHIALEQRFLHDARDVFGLHASVPDACVRQRAGPPGTWVCPIRGDVQDHVPGPFVASDVGYEAEIHGRRGLGYAGVEVRRFDVDASAG